MLQSTNRQARYRAILGPISVREGMITSPKPAVRSSASSLQLMETLISYMLASPQARKAGGEARRFRILVCVAPELAIANFQGGAWNLQGSFLQS